MRELYDLLERLAADWHKAAAMIEGYDAYAAKGHGTGLFLMLNHAPDEGVRLTAVAVKDFMRYLDPQTSGDSTMPIASIIIRPS